MSKVESRERRNDEVAAPRGVPKSEEAEKGFLCSALLMPEIVEDYGDLTEEHFWHPGWMLIFRALVAMREAGQAIDFITVVQWLTDKDEIDKVGGPAMISELFTFVSTATNARYYAEILREKFALRRIIAVTTRLGAAAYACEGSPDELLNEAEGALLELRSAKSSDGRLRQIRPDVESAILAIEKTYKNRGDVTGLATGITDFDRSTGGLQPQQLIVIGARPGQGKTALLMNMAEHMAITLEKPVGVFSLEMGGQQLAQRLLCCRSELNLQRVRDGFLSREKISDVMRESVTIAKAPVFLDDTPAITVFDFRARARRMVRKFRCAAVFVDYLQLMRSTSPRAQMSRTIEIAEISMCLKATAKELEVPVIAAVQLSRDAEQRVGPPKLSDIRESGQCEQDADIVAFLHRPNKDNEEANEDGELVQFIIAKQRDGPTPNIALKFRREWTRFENTTEKMYSNNPKYRQSGSKAKRQAEEKREQGLKAVEGGHIE